MLSNLVSNTGIPGLSGYGLIAMICGLVLVEELGVPLVFAPGDLLLVVAGVAISTSDLNPLIVVSTISLSVLGGALAGRELFERIGLATVFRFARVLHLSGHLDTLAAKLRRHGAAAVFAGRLVPGLRAHTTEVSGLIRMPRSRFLAGLVPAVGVYEFVFIGLGAWVGPTAWSAVEQFAPMWLPALIALGAVVVSVLVGRALARLLVRGQARTQTVAITSPMTTRAVHKRTLGGS